MRNLFGVYIEFKASFTPVSFQLYTSFDYAHCFEFIAEHTQTKKRRLYAKQIGYRHRFYNYDERFAAELEARQDVASDEFYEEATTDDLASVQIHKREYRPVVWRGLQQGRAIPDSNIEPSTSEVWHGAKRHGRF